VESELLGSLLRVVEVSSVCSGVEVSIVRSIAKRVADTHVKYQKGNDASFFRDGHSDIYLPKSTQHKPRGPTIMSNPPFTYTQAGRHPSASNGEPAKCARDSMVGRWGGRAAVQF
jgi:hypothetical protein